MSDEKNTNENKYYILDFVYYIIEINKLCIILKYTSGRCIGAY